MRSGRIQLVCDSCTATITFAGSDAGTVQDCPKCGAFMDVPEFRREGAEYPFPPEKADDFEERKERQWAESERQFKVAQAHLEWSERQLERADRADQRREELQEQDAKLQARWAELLERFARVLDPWERDIKLGRPTDRDDAK